MLRSRLFSLLYSKVTPEPICNAAHTYAILPQALLRGWSASSASGLGAAVRGLHTSSIQQDFVTLNNISDNPGATKTGKRLGRGIGSGKGKTSGRGHKGQKARTGRKVKIGFEGGQTPIKQYTPKRGFHNPFSNEYVPLNLFKLKEAIDMGRLTERQLITMRDLREAGVIHRKIKDGVKLLGRGAAEFDKSVNLQVSQVSDSAKQAVERQGGSVTTVYYNKLGLRALTMPEWFEKKGRSIPKAARPHPKKRDAWDAIGSLPPSPMPAPSGSSAQAQVRSPE